MSRFNRFPPSVRYTIGRLRRWMQPGVWAPLAVMLVGGMFIWEVSVNPERLSVDDKETARRSNNPASGELSADDSAIAADIDSLPVLVDELNRSNSELSALNSPLVKGKGLFDEIRTRGLDIPKPPSVPKQAVRDAVVPELSLTNSVVTAIGSDPQNINPSNSSTTAASIPASGVGQVPGIGPIVPDLTTAAATLPQTAIGLNSAQPSPNSIPLSPLQAAMQKYQAANPNQATDAPNSASSGILPDRTPASGLGSNSANLLPAPATAQIGANPASFQAAPTPLPVPTTTIISDSQQFLNPGATASPSNSEWAPRQPEIPSTPAVPATVALPRNPYQTNLSGSGWTGEMQPVPLPAIPSPAPQAPNAGQLRLPGGIRDSRVVNPEFSPNSANSQYQQGQPSQWNLPAQQPNFGSVPQNANGGGQPIQPQPFAVPRQIPGRYIGGGEINTFADP
ncbi:MAG: hypothetical protein HC786_27440 [Richelia sp. CSU_2_1]|nr:hypothetical protein [Richelia sp. CSU_2_1]